MTRDTHPNIVRAAASGDDEALTRLVRAYHDRAYRFGQRVCRDGFDADDAVQEAFVALARRPDVVGHGGALSWLMTSIRNACLGMLRPFLRERRSLGEHVGGIEDVVSPLLDPQQALERAELVRSVHSAIAALPRPYREVVVMRDLEGLSGEETCQSLGLEPAAMKTRLHRARQQIRELMEQSKRDAEREN
jgi:RNA polymerase sigma-70 factor (ECF subfamily)